MVALSEQAGVSIGLPDPDLGRMIVPPVSGSLTVEQALRRMLGGRARYVRVGPRAYRILRAQAGSAPRPTTRAPRSTATGPAGPPPEEALERAEREIIVTGSRRLAPLRTYPGSIEVMGAQDEALQEPYRGSEALVSRLPTLTSTHLGPGRNKLFVRGVSDSSFTGPIQATTGQYLGETRMNYGVPDPSLQLYDLERVEVLSGPQGTLYGAGSMGGIIRLIPNAPDAGRVETETWLGASATAHGGLGYDAAGLVNVPLVDGRAAMRLVGYSIVDAGYIDDTQRGLSDVNQARTLGGRAAVRVHLGEHWLLDLGAVGQRIRGDDSQHADRSGVALTRASPVGQPFENDYVLGNLVLTREGQDVRWITAAGIKRQSVHEQYDATSPAGPPSLYVNDTETEFLTIESRLSSAGATSLGWVVGGSVGLNQHQQRRARGPVGAVNPVAGIENRVLEMAVFGEWSTALSDATTLILGGRISHSPLSAEGLNASGGGPAVALPIPERERSETFFLPAAALAAQVSPETVVYLRYQESYRPGGVSLFDNEFRSFDHDRLRALEGGLRYGLPGHGAFDATAALIYSHWSNLQADTIGPDGLPCAGNFGDGRILALDLSAGWRPVAGLNLHASALISDTRMDHYDLGTPIDPDSPLPNVAWLNARLAASYRMSLWGRGDLRLSAAARYAGKSNLGVGGNFVREQGDWLDVSLGASLALGRSVVSLTATNLLDQRGNRFAFGSPTTIDHQDHVTPLRPRTLRLGVHFRF